MRRALIPLLTALVLLGGPLPAPAAKVLDRIVAVVNDDVVLQSELDTEMATVRAQLQRRNVKMPPHDVLQRQVLERLVMQKLQLSAAERMGISVDDATLDAAVRRVAQRNNLSLSEFRDALEREGMDMAGYREQLRRDIVISRVRQREMQQRVNVTPQEIEQTLEQNKGNQQKEYRLAHILIAVPEAASPNAIQQARSQAEDVRRQLQQGADFANMAARYSDSRTALEGGDLGWRSAGQIPTMIADRVPDMNPGDVTQVLRSPSGFHLFQLSDVRKGKRHIVTQTHARHILIRPNAVVSDQDAEQRLQSLRRRIENGESFTELARSNSDDKGTASDGGDLGWVDPQNMDPRFSQVMDSLQPGQISRPFKTRFGWHIVQVLDRRDQDTTEDYQRNEVAKQIRQRKEDEEMELWLRQLREEAYVDYRLES
ncbi:MAG: peptidylprolyl isomerase [Ectothiorhodospiraceae bacterium]